MRVRNRNVNMLLISIWTVKFLLYSQSTSVCLMCKAASKRFSEHVHMWTMCIGKWAAICLHCYQKSESTSINSSEISAWKIKRAWASLSLSANTLWQAKERKSKTKQANTLENQGRIERQCMIFYFESLRKNLHRSRMKNWKETTQQTKEVNESSFNKIELSNKYFIRWL